MAGEIDNDDPNDTTRDSYSDSCLSDAQRYSGHTYFDDGETIEKDDDEFEDFESTLDPGDLVEYDWDGDFQEDDDNGDFQEDNGYENDDPDAGSAEDTR